MNISIIGTGYVGLVTGACLADKGIQVLCMDQDAEKIKKLKACQIPIFEPGLQDLVSRNLDKTLHFTYDMKEAVDYAQVIFIAVGTPLRENGSADLSQVVAAVKEITRFAESEKTIVSKSTVPVGTGNFVKKLASQRLLKKNKSFPIHVVSNPEFLREGNAVSDFTNPDRIILGAEAPEAFEAMEKIYGFQLEGGVPLLKTNLETAEMIKYASNTFLAMKISYINEIANLCEICGADALQVAGGMGLDQRIGPLYLEPGPGFGGSCFHKDVTALITLAKKMGYTMKMAKSVVDTNILQRRRMLKKIKKLAGELEGKTITILGLAFKPGTDDIRESPAIEIIKLLLKKKAVVQVCDPQAMENMKKQFPSLEVEYCMDWISACQGSDCIVLATPWEEFRHLNFEVLRLLAHRPNFVDLRNTYLPEEVRKAGFCYEGVGRN